MHGSTADRRHRHVPRVTRIACHLAGRRAIAALKVRRGAGPGTLAAPTLCRRPRRLRIHGRRLRRTARRFRNAPPRQPAGPGRPTTLSRSAGILAKRGRQVSSEGSLRTFLGTAPGVGKTFAMLAEGRRRADNGERVVAGWIEWHGRPETRQQLSGLEVIAPRRVAYRGTVFADFDASAAIASGADVVLVDELAHATADRTRQRWQDVADVLRAGLDVVTTMNVAHLRSVRDYAAWITGVGTVAWVPDEFVRSGEVVRVDLPAEALRARIAAGAVYSAEQAGGALADYFRAANLQALSELGRAWMAGTVEAVGDELLVRLGLAEPSAQAVVVAGDSGSRWGELVIRRAAELARADDARSEEHTSELQSLRHLVCRLLLDKKK